MAELPKLTTGQIVGGSVALGSLAILGATAGVIAHKRKNKKRRKAKNKSVRSRVYRNKRKKLKFGSKAYRKKYLNHGRKHRRTPHTAGKRKDTSHRRIRYTSRGQPYIIGAHGKARFISRKSAKSSYRRKGGRY